MTHKQIINAFKIFVDNNAALISQYNGGAEEDVYLAFDVTTSDELVSQFSEYLKACEAEKFFVYYTDVNDRQTINDMEFSYNDATFLGTIETLPTEKRYNRKSVASELPRVGEIIKSPYGTAVEVISVNQY